MPAHLDGMALQCATAQPTKPGGTMMDSDKVETAESSAAPSDRVESLRQERAKVQAERKRVRAMIAARAADSPRLD